MEFVQAQLQPGTITGAWVSDPLANPFDNQDQYRLVFQLHGRGDRILGNVRMISEAGRYDVTKNLIDGKVDNNHVVFATPERAYLGLDTVSYKDFYDGNVTADRIEFVLSSDRPSGFPAQRFVAKRA